MNQLQRVKVMIDAQYEKLGKLNSAKLGQRQKRVPKYKLAKLVGEAVRIHHKTNLLMTPSKITLELFWDPYTHY